MHVGGYKRHARQNDVSLVQGLPMSECHPFIENYQESFINSFLDSFINSFFDGFQKRQHIHS